MLKKLSYKFLIPTIVLMIIVLIITAVVITNTVHDFYETSAIEKSTEKLNELNDKLNLIDALVLEEVQIGMNALKSEAAQFGSPSINGTTEFFGKEIPNLQLGSESVTNKFAVVDKVKKIAGGTATIFVNNNGEFLRVSTNVVKSSGERAIGTILDPNGKANHKIQNRESYYE